MYHGDRRVRSEIMGHFENARLDARSWLEMSLIGQDLFFNSFYSAPQRPVSKTPRLSAYCYTTPISAHTTSAVQGLQCDEVLRPQGSGTAGHATLYSRLSGTHAISLARLISSSLCLLGVMAVSMPRLLCNIRTWLEIVISGSSSIFVPRDGQKKGVRMAVR